VTPQTFKKLLNNNSCATCSCPSLYSKRQTLVYGRKINFKSTNVSSMQESNRQQNVGQNHDIKIGNRCFENVAQFRYLGTTITNQNLIQEEIKRRLNSGNACYHSVQNLLSSRLLSRNIKIRIYKTIILPLVLCGCET
jgi:hypothetical protein